MGSQQSAQSLWCGAHGTGHQVTAHTEFCSQQLLVSPLSHPAKALHRQMLVSELFKHVKEIQGIDNGYAFCFHHSDDLEDLLGNIAEYIVFESLNSPQLTFNIVEAPQAKAFWLQIQGVETNHRDVTSPSSTPGFGVSSMVSRLPF